VLEDERLAVKLCDMGNILCKTKWVYAIKAACEANWLDWILIAGNTFPFADTGQTERCFEHVTKTELQRLVLAVYQFDAYTSRLQGGVGDVSHDAAAELSKLFFQHLTPWDKEQIISVGEIMTHIYEEGMPPLPFSYLVLLLVR